LRVTAGFEGCRLKWEKLSYYGQIAQNRVTAYSGGAACANAASSSQWRRVANPIFISYRRDDSEGEAGRLFDDLTREFGSQNVFMDVAGIRPGVDFVKAIETNVADCGVLLAIIGPTWATITNAHGLRRLDDPNDFVVLEIASALKREVPVIPVLVHAAKMPSPDELPESLKSFSHRNSVELSHTRWPSDVSLLIEALKSYVVPTKETAPEPVHANVPVQLPAPHQPGAPSGIREEPKRSSSILWVAVVAGIAAIAVAVYIYRAMHPVAPAPPAVSQSQPAAPSPAVTASPAPAAPSDAAPVTLAPKLVGTWIDTGRHPGHGDTLTRLVIASSGSSLTIHGFGVCEPPPCDWGTAPATLDGQTATATFKLSGAVGNNSDRVALVRVTPNGRNLDVNVSNTFTTASDSHSNQVHRTFVPER
jgi:hypothetical protein